jgi:hypothetical protein
MLRTRIDEAKMRTELIKLAAGIALLAPLWLGWSALNSAPWMADWAIDYIGSGFMLLIELGLAIWGMWLAVGAAIALIRRDRTSASARQRISAIRKGFFGLLLLVPGILLFLALLSAERNGTGALAVGMTFPAIPVFGLMDLAGLVLLGFALRQWRSNRKVSASLDQ